MCRNDAAVAAAAGEANLYARQVSERRAHSKGRPRGDDRRRPSNDEINGYDLLMAGLVIVGTSSAGRQVGRAVQQRNWQQRQQTHI